MLIFAWKSSFVNHTNQNQSIWNWTDLLQESVYKEWNGICYTSWRMRRLNTVDWRPRVWPDQIGRPICCQLLVQCILISLFQLHRYYTGKCVTGRFNLKKNFNGQKNRNLLLFRYLCRTVIRNENNIKFQESVKHNIYK